MQKSRTLSAFSPTAFAGQRGSLPGSVWRAAERISHPGLDLRVLVAVGLGGILVSLAALALSGVAGRWDVGLLASGVALLSSAGLIGGLILHGKRQAHVLDQSLLTAALEASLHARAISDKKGNLLCANSAYLRLFEGRMPAPCDYGADGPDNAAKLKQIFTGLKKTARGKGEFEFSAEEGKTSFFVTARSSGRYVIWTLPIASNRSLLKDAEFYARQSLESGLAAMNMGLTLLDQKGRMCYLSPTLAEMVGEDTAADLRDKPVGALIDRDAGIFTAGILKGRDVEFYRLPLPGDNEGEPTGVYLLLRPITVPDEKPAPVETTSADLANIFDQAPIAMATVGNTGALRAFNKSFCKLVPEGSAQKGQPLAELIDKADRREFEIRLKAAISGLPPALPFDVHLACEKPTIVQVYFGFRQTEDGPGAVLYWLDLTEQKSLELQFVQAQKMQAVGQLAGGVAHDFNNLLTAIIGFSDLLLMRHSAGDQSFSDIMQVKQNANRAANLVRQLLAFSRQQTLRPKILIVTDVLAEISNLVRRLIGENIELKMVHGRSLGAVKVDQGQLEQVLINLAVNARDAMPDGGTLSIRTANIDHHQAAELDHSIMPASEYVMIEVADTGAGISQKNREKVFEPFFTTKEVGQGTGLGLSTVYGIVKQTGGFIFVDSEEGRGAVFRIYLPTHRESEKETGAAASRKEQESKAKDLTGKETILIVEDEEPVRMFAVRALQNKGYKVLEAVSGEEGLEIVKSYDGAIDLMISDVIMPGMDGPTLVAEAQQIRPKTKIIFISGYAEDAIRKNLSDHKYSFLPKPFSLKRLAEEVRDILEEK